MVKEIYILSGLGVDERVFQKIDFSGFSPIFIKWITPNRKETVQVYAKRLLDQIKHPKPIIIGLSFGGMIAMEIAKLIDTENVILIASAKTKNEIPPYYRLIGKFNLHKLLPNKVLKFSNAITNWLFGATSSSDKQLLKQILKDTDAVFLKWAIDIVVKWSNDITPKNVFHIHGNSDKILPLRFVKCDLVIKNGGHLMTMNKSEELSYVLNQELIKE